MENVVRRQQTQRRLERLSSMQIGNRQDKVSDALDIITRAVQEQYPNMNGNDARFLSKSLILAPKNSTINIGGKEENISSLRYQIACTIESLGSETSSEEEYFSWFNEADEIIKDMNDGRVTEEELEDKQEWIEYSYGREAELMTCLALFQESRFADSQEKAKKIYNKLVKLRQIRSTIKESTANRADPEYVDNNKKKEDRRKAVPYLTLLKDMTKMSRRCIYWNACKKRLKRLGIYHGNDDDLSDDYDDMYDDFDDLYDEEGMRLSDEEIQAIEEEIAMSKEDISERIESGRLVYSFFDDLQNRALFFSESNEEHSAERFVEVDPSYRSVAEDFLAKVAEAHQVSQTKAEITQRVQQLRGLRSKTDDELSSTPERPRSFNREDYNSFSARRNNYYNSN